MAKKKCKGCRKKFENNDKLLKHIKTSINDACKNILLYVALVINCLQSNLTLIIIEDNLITLITEPVFWCQIASMQQQH